MKSFKQLRSDITEAAWTRKEGKKKSGGLNEKGRKSTREKILDQTLKHQAKRLEIPAGNPSALE